MTVDWFLKMTPNYSVTYEQIVFAHYLERRGMRFCVDFGFENAESITWSRMDYEGYVQ